MSTDTGKSSCCFAQACAANAESHAPIQIQNFWVDFCNAAARRLQVNSGYSRLVGFSPFEFPCEPMYNSCGLLAFSHCSIIPIASSESCALYAAICESALKACNAKPISWTSFPMLHRISSTGRDKSLGQENRSSRLFFLSVFDVQAMVPPRKLVRTDEWCQARK